MNRESLAIITELFNDAISPDFFAEEFVTGDNYWYICRTLKEDGMGWTTAHVRVKYGEVVISYQLPFPNGGQQRLSLADPEFSAKFKCHIDNSWPKGEEPHHDDPALRTPRFLLNRKTIAIERAPTIFNMFGPLWH